MKITVEQLKSCLSYGMTDAAIAKKYNMSTFSIRNRRQEEDLPGGSQKKKYRQEVSNEQIAQHVQDGWKDWRIAARYDVSPQHIKRRRAELNLISSPRVARERDDEMMRLAAEGLIAEEIGRQLRPDRPLSGRAVALRCQLLGIKLARARLEFDSSNPDEESPAVIRARREAAEEKMAAAMAGHSYESLQIKSHGAQKFPRPITHCETASSAALAVV